MSEEIQVAICMHCCKPIYVSDGSLISEYGLNYHVKCYESRHGILTETTKELMEAMKDERKE